METWIAGSPTASTDSGPNMGFSVSGSAAIIFLAAFLSFGILFTTGSSGFERVQDARASTNERALEQQNTAISILSVSNTGPNTLSVTVHNGGSTTLHVEDVDVLLNGTYHVPDAMAISTESNPDLWEPGEDLTVTLSYPAAGTIRVKVVSGHGVSSFREVTF